MELHDDLEVGGGRAVDGVQVDRRVVRLLDLLRALLVEDLAQGAGVPAIMSESDVNSLMNDFLLSDRSACQRGVDAHGLTDFVALGNELLPQLATIYQTNLHKHLVEELIWHA